MVKNGLLKLGENRLELLECRLLRHGEDRVFERRLCCSVKVSKKKGPELRIEGQSRRTAGFGGVVGIGVLEPDEN